MGSRALPCFDQLPRRQQSIACTAGESRQPFHTAAPAAGHWSIDLHSWVLHAVLVPSTGLISGRMLTPRRSQAGAAVGEQHWISHRTAPSRNVTAPEPEPHNSPSLLHVPAQHSYTWPTAFPRGKKHQRAGFCDSIMFHGLGAFPWLHCHPWLWCLFWHQSFL